MKFRKVKQRLTTNEMLSHCKTSFRDKPVVFGCLGRTAAALMETQSLYATTGEDTIVFYKTVTFPCVNMPSGWFIGTKTVKVWCWLWHVHIKISSGR